MKRRPNVGEHVVFCDSKGQDHDALVTCDWGGCINLVYVENDENRKDQYGRQISHGSSVTDADRSTAHGNYWRFPDDEKRAYTPPVSS